MTSTADAGSKDLDLLDLYDELESLFHDGDEKSSIHREHLIT